MKLQCDICESIAGTWPVIVPMPGLRVEYHVCSDECEEQARERGRKVWDEFKQLPKAQQTAVLTGIEQAEQKA